jgi:hypothetical protein
MSKVKQDPLMMTMLVDRYTKDQILSSKRFADRKDIVGVVLKDSVKYSIDEVEQHINEFMKGKVD